MSVTVDVKEWVHANWPILVMLAIVVGVVVFFGLLMIPPPRRRGPYGLDSILIGTCL